MLFLSKIPNPISTSKTTLHALLPCTTDSGAAEQRVSAATDEALTIRSKPLRPGLLHVLASFWTMPTVSDCSHALPSSIARSASHGHHADVSPRSTTSGL
jgi:hypothetical protein